MESHPFTLQNITKTQRQLPDTPLKAHFARLRGQITFLAEQ